MELTHISEPARATRKGGAELLRLGMAWLSIVGVLLYTLVRGEARGSLFTIKGMLID